MQFNKFVRIQINKSDKKASKKWSVPANQFRACENINHKLFNVGVLTGSINNIIVVDVDVKDDGIEEMNKYISEYGIIETLTVKTPSGGNHYYFNYNGQDYDDNYLIENYLKNSSKYRNGKGIDIRSNGGYIIAPPSEYDGKKYEVSNDCKIIDMPRTLIDWLLLGKNLSSKPAMMTRNINLNKKIDITKYKYNITDDEIIDILHALDKSYCDQTNKWLIVTTVLKNLSFSNENAKQIWDDYSKPSTKYNKQNNFIIWDTNEALIDINYLIHVLNKELNENQYKKIPKCKVYEPLTSQKNICNIDQPYIKIAKYENDTEEQLKLYNKDIEQHFFNDHTMIIESCTGTGKSTSVSKAIYEYNQLKNNKYKVLSIVSKISLGMQHIKTFQDANIVMSSYSDKTTNFKDDNIVICINSIMLLKQIHEDELKNYIVYIDEITSFLKDLTHNETLRGTLKICYQTLMKIIKNCHKLIVSDAIISDNVYNFIKTRENKHNRTFFIKNTFQKYKDVNAIRIRDEEQFLKLLTEHVVNGEYFLFGCDSCTTVTDFYNECKKWNRDEDEDNFILITRKSKFTITDASEQFKNKFVFYSPSIIFGVDFSIDEKQDSFIYNKGRTLDPSSIYQQTTRCRNIRNLYYYSELDNNEANYNTLRELQEYYTQICNISIELNNLCVYNDENDDEKIMENTFFTLYTYNEYLKDIYNTNKTMHYENILRANGFILSSQYERKKISKYMNKKLHEPTIIQNENNFNNLLLENGEVLDNEMVVRFEYLKIPSDNHDLINKYKDIIMDEFVFNDHLNVIRLLKSEDYINIHINQLHNDNYNAVVNNSIYHKIKILYDIERGMNITHLNVNKCNEIKMYNIPEDTFKYMKKIFRITRPKPSNTKDLFILYISIIKNITCKDFITSLKSTKRNDKTTYYSLNEEFIKYHIDLNKLSNPKLKNYHHDTLEMLNIEIPICETPEYVNRLDNNIDNDIFVD